MEKVINSAWETFNSQLRLSLTLVILLVADLDAEAQVTIDEKYVQEQISKVHEYTLLVWHLSNTQAPKDSIQKWKNDHLRILFQLQAENKVSFFGPITNNKSMVGIAVFNTADTELVNKQIERDPLVENKFLTYTLCKWYSVPDQKLQPTSVGPK